MLSALAVLGLLVAAGTPAIMLMPEGHRRRLVPALPVLGAATAVVLGNWISRAVSYRIGVWLLLAVAACGVLGSLVRPGVRAAFDRQSLAALALMVVVALPSAYHLATVSAAPQGGSPASAGLAFTTSNHDAYYFSALTDWFVDHPVHQVPSVGRSSASQDGPANSPAKMYQSFQRWGESSLQGIPTALGGGRTSQHWRALTALWVVLLPSAVYLLSLGLGASTRWSVGAGVASGLVLSGGAVVSFSVLNQNGPFVLGLVLLLAAGGCVAQALLRSSSERQPQVLAALLVAAFVGTYFELVVVAVPLFGALAALSIRRPFVDSVRRVVELVGLSLVAAGPAVVYAVRGLLTVAGAAPQWKSYFEGDSGTVVAGKLLGIRLIGPGLVAEPPPSALLVFGVVLLWLIALGVALLHPASRWVLGAVLGVGIAVWWVESRGATNYSANRVASMVAVVAAALVLSGASAALSARRNLPDRVTVLSATSWVLVASVIVVPATWTQVAETAKLATSGRSFTADDAAAAGWVRQFGGRSGEKVLVVTESFTLQLMMLDALRRSPDVGWAVLQPDYTGLRSFRPSAAAGYALVSKPWWAVGSPLVRRSNATWALVDLQPGSAVLAPPQGVVSAPAGAGRDAWTGPAGAQVHGAAAIGCRRFDLELNSLGPPQRVLSTGAREGGRLGLSRVLVRRSPSVTVGSTTTGGVVSIELRPLPPTEGLSLLVEPKLRCVGPRG